MSMILDGKKLASLSEEEFKIRVSELKENTGATPILATILVGNYPASTTYVKMKGNACKRVGMKSLKVELPGSTSTEELLTKIQELNENPRTIQEHQSTNKTRNIQSREKSTSKPFYCIFFLRAARNLFVNNLFVNKTVSSGAFGS